MGKNEMVIRAMVVPKLIFKVSDASGFAQFVRVYSRLSCQKHN
jgi:hypothetical protein